MIRPALGLALLLFFFSFPAGAVSLDWEALPPLPEAISGQAVGVHNGALIVAGGSNFPVSPFQGGKKQWKDGLYVLEPGAEAWLPAGTLPGPRAYAGAVSTPDGMLILGGTDGETCFSDLLRLVWRDGALEVERVPLPLPSPCAFGAAAYLDTSVYVAGGQASPDATQALDTCWRLDLDAAEPQWESVGPLPGGARILPAMAAQSGKVFVFSGAALFDKDGSASRRFLADAHAYSPGEGWAPVAPVPQVVVAAPATAYGIAHILVFSGDDGSNFGRNEELGDNHPGFPAMTWAYHTITDTWVEAGEAPEAYVTTQAVVWQDRMVIPGGEDRPGHRGASVMSASPAKRIGGLNALDYAAITVYLGALIVMGAYFSRREKSTEAFFLGGRRVPWWAVGLSIFGTSLSAITYLSIPARAFATNWVYMVANTGILFAAPFVVWFYIPQFRRAPIQTAYEYLEKRFNLLIRIYGSLCFMIFQIGRVGIVMLLPAIALSAATGIDIYLCIGAMGLLATIYTAMGGIEAVIWTDVLQAIVLVLGAVLALVIITLNIDGGLSGLVATAAAADKFHAIDWTWDITTTGIFVMVVGNAFSSLYPSTADQTVVQRYLSTASAQSAGRAVWTNAALTVPITLLFFSLGTALWVFFRENPSLLDPGLKNDAVLPLFVVSEFPMGLRGVLIAGIFAAAMSSLDSSINSVSSVLVNDYYRRFVPDAKERSAFRAARVLTVLFGGIGTMMAMYVAQDQSVSLWDPFLRLLNFVGGGLAGLFALGVFTKRANGNGAVVGAIAGAIAVVAAGKTELHPLMHGAVGFGVTFAVGYLASLPGGGKKPAAE